MIFLVCLFVGLTRPAYPIEPPRVAVDGWRIELIRQEPELVTPTGCCFDSSGRLYVIECHTHFPPEDYPGPKVDHIYSFDDTDGDGAVDAQRLYFIGGQASMGIAAGDDGWIYVVTRSNITRIRDTNGDGAADQAEPLVRHETTADYPHNGLSSIAFGPHEWLYFGQGENFGERYRLIGTDGSEQTGAGEGGNIFRCRHDGSRLERVATGIWNPFGTCFDDRHRLWAVENDPDARPPCRLLHVVEAGDYGFQFRFGRAGTHPLLAWNGELPGTLPMAAGTGEAPCAVLPYDDHLWVTSWGDNRIERFHLAPQGASWQGTFSTAVQGDVTFRPVSLAIAPNRSIYVTDWVDRSYPVHQKGRLWRLVPSAASPQTLGLPEDTAVHQQADRLAHEPSVTWDERMSASRSADPFLISAAVAGAVRCGQYRTSAEPTTPEEYLMWLQAWRWSELSKGSFAPQSRLARLSTALQHESESVRRLAIRYAAEAGEKSLIDRLRQNLARIQIRPLEFSETVAAISFLETGTASPKVRDPQREALLIGILQDVHQSEAVRAMALRYLPGEAEVPMPGEAEESIEEQIDRWVHQSTGSEFRREAVWLLAFRPAERARETLLRWIMDPGLDEVTRADAVAALAAGDSDYRTKLEPLLRDGQTPPLVQQEIVRTVHRPEANSDRPDVKDFDAWQRAVGQGGDAAAGRRVLLRSTCLRCHAYHGRGFTLGPDLAFLQNNQSRARILQSILDPSREIAPLYSTWRVSTSDGRVLVGIKLNGGGVGTNLRYQAADGTLFELPLTQIEEQEATGISIMPADIVHQFSIPEMRDLLAFLEHGA